MGRKIKSVLFLIVILILIYWQHSPVIYAEEKGNVKHNSDTEEEREENEDEETDDEEEITKYELQCSEADGKNGYYITAPDVEIRHPGKCGKTVYKLQNNGEIKAEGELNQEKAAVVLAGEQFGEGSNILTVYMEDENGMKVDGFEDEREFLVDTQAPVFQMQASDGFDTWYQKEAWISVFAEDGETGSQIHSISCYCGNQIVGTVKDSNGKFLIDHASEGNTGVNITVTVVDRAGNKCEKTKCLYIDNYAPKVTMEGITDYMITSQPANVICKVLEDNQLMDCRVEVEWESADGKKQILPEVMWAEKGGGKETAFLLSEDGFYHMKVSAVDMAGYSDTKEMQIMIDSHNPVIRYVDMLEGQYMKRFRWEYSREAFIQDLTSYVYQMQVDGKLYFIGDEITQEGRHILKVEATDSAGNKAEAKARFVIDHTPPEIEFSGVEEEETYEEERTFKITLKNPEDEIREVRINGISQPLVQGGNAYQYTVQEYKSYEVKVKAVDKAGNQSESEVTFEVIPRENLLQRTLKPVRRLLSDEGEGNKARKGSETGIFLVCAGILAVCALGIAGVIWYRYRRKKSHNPRID